MKSCPLCKDGSPELFHADVWNGPGRRVMRCPDCDAYFLDPLLTEGEQRAFDENYDRYIAARAAAVLPHADKTFDAQVDDSIAERLRDIGQWFPPGASVLEIGAEKGGFLDLIAPAAGAIAAVDSCPEYVTILQGKGYAAYRYVWDVPAAARYDRVCLFSLLEHIPEPDPFLMRLRECLAPGGQLIVEIPSAQEPLLSLYDIAAFKSFYFQAMHPYVYSEKAAKLVLARAGFEVAHVRYKQRYGLANHLNWLKTGAPGGSARFAALFSGSADRAYVDALESSGITDTIYIVAKAAEAGR